MEKLISQVHPGEDIVIEGGHEDVVEDGYSHGPNPGGAIVEVVEVVREPSGSWLVRARTGEDIQDFVFERDTTVQTRWAVPVTLAAFRRALAVAVRSVSQLPEVVSMETGVETFATESLAADFATILGYVDNVEWEGLAPVVDAWRDIQDMTKSWAVPASQMTPTIWWNAVGDIVQDAMLDSCIAWLRAYAFRGLRGPRRAARLAEAFPTLAQDVRRWLAQAQ